MKKKRILPVIFAAYSIYQIIITTYQFIYLLNISKNSKATFFISESTVASQMQINSFWIVILSYVSTFFVFICTLIIAIYFIVHTELNEYNRLAILHTFLYCAAAGLVVYTVLDYIKLTHSFIPIAITLLIGIIYFRIYTKKHMINQQK